MPGDPLILTARLDGQSFRFFDGMHRRHFPPARNLIPAHLTLFHKLPADAEAEIVEVLESVAEGCGTIPLAVAALRFLGHGSAYEIRSPVLVGLRAELAKRWADRLTPQDAQAFKPHVTLQNKVLGREAKALYEELSSGFVPFEATATGLLLWRYRGGPWEAAGTFPFADADA